MSLTEKLPPLRDPNALVDAMAKVARTLATDLVERARDPRVEPSLQESWALEKKAGQTGEAFEIWRTAFCDQVAASWVLCTVFVRTLEDRGLLPHRLAGPGASDQLASFRRQFRFLSERDYLFQIFDGLAEPPPSWPRERPASEWVGAQVFGRHAAPLWKLSPSAKALATLLDTLGAKDGDTLRFTFGRPDGVEHDGSTTRFLGDLYQDLNEAVRKRYALLQTPDFVERFILDQTLTPALEERGVAVTVCDPACGSGHFLLGAFDRLFEARGRRTPGEQPAELARKALGQVYGIDLNPYAAAIARFRLVVSFLDKAGLSTLERFPADLHVNVFVGDALLSGFQSIQGVLGGTDSAAGFGRQRGFSLFDPEAHGLLSKTRFDVVVANPPYITEKDATKRELIRTNYKAAAGKYALSAPFAERIFQLANEAGWTGQITANSFMKREFGKSLIEEVLPRLDLTKVIDTSGAYIPGHGTPTVLLFGRNRWPVAKEAQIVRGTRGEPSTPEDPARGQVWSTIAAHHDDVVHEDSFISVGRIERSKLGEHPWSIGGGGAAELKELLEERSPRRLESIVESIGFMAITGEDDLFVVPDQLPNRLGLPSRCFGTGDVVRDWAVTSAERVVFDYTDEWAHVGSARVLRHFWPFRTTLSNRLMFGKTQLEAGLPWSGYRHFGGEKVKSPLSITFAFVATHNHFVLDRGGKVFNRSAPIIKLPAGATEEEHLALLGYLNSSTACFWMKQVFQPKSGSGIGRGIQPEKWMERFEHDGTKLQACPIPKDLSELRELGTRLDALATKRSSLLPERTLATATYDVRAALEAAHRQFDELTREMVAVQEELDWAAYRALSLSDHRPKEMLTAGSLRAFEVRLARSAADGEKTDWFERHGRQAEVSANDAISGSLAEIAENDVLRLIEHPDYKRRWEPFDWNGAVGAAAQAFLLDAIERHLELHRTGPRPVSVRALAQAFSADAKLLAVAEVVHGSSNFELDAVLGELMSDDSVSSATSQLYTDEGLEPRRLWEQCWALQRREDAGEKVTIDVPPKYDREDYQNSNAVWRHRGKLDVPKERFIAYLTATPPAGATGAAGRVFGWAGWNHLEQLQAVIALWQDEWTEHGGKLVPRASRDAADEARRQADADTRAKLLPLLQTMVDLLPWVRQWHNQDGETADQFEKYVAEECRKVEMGAEEVHLWRAPKVERRGRTARGPKTAAGVSLSEDAVLEIVRAEGEVAVARIGERLGAAAAKVKAVVDGLVESGKLVEVRKRPRTVLLGKQS